MIAVKFRGRLGNVMFTLSLADHLAQAHGTEVAIVPNDANADRDYYARNLIGREFFRQWKVITEEEARECRPHIHNNNELYKASGNCLLYGYFNNKSVAYGERTRELFRPSKEITEELMDLYGPTRDSLSMHIRRGDFLDQQNVEGGWYSCPKEYWEAAYKLMGRKYDKVFVMSDDIPWCRENLTFSDKIIFADKDSENPSLFMDLFLPSLCGDNIISASTFSWWGQYLNPYENKRVILPYPWNTIPDNARNSIFYTDGCMKLGIYDYELK